MRQIEEPRRAEVTTFKRAANPKGVLLIDAAVLEPLRWVPQCKTCNDAGYIVKTGYSHYSWREACPDCPPQQFRTAGAL
jgi:hypothetical protein